MKSITVRKQKIGEGIPKICVPIVGKTSEEISAQARAILSLPVDLVEWRCDWFERADDKESVLGVLNEVRSILGDIPLIFTFRTSDEGGEKEIPIAEYVSLNRAVIESGYADLIDVQMFLGDDVLKSIVEYARSYGMLVIASNHDFQATPEKAEVVFRLQHMRELGADIAKIAVMPNSKEDVETLLAATREVSQNNEGGPIVTMSMSELGRVSRIEGEIYGSAITFGSAGESSAPGQIPAGELARLLRKVHEKI